MSDYQLPVELLPCCYSWLFYSLEIFSADQLPPYFFQSIKLGSVMMYSWFRKAPHSCHDGLDILLDTEKAVIITALISKWTILVAEKNTQRETHTLRRW